MSDLLNNVVRDYEKDIEDLERVFKVVKKINNSSVKVLFENVVIEKILFLKKLIKSIKEVIESTNDKEPRAAPEDKEK